MNQDNNGRAWLGDETGIRLKRVAVMLLIFLSLLAVTKSISEMRAWSTIGKNATTVSTISVTGKGEMIAIPDIATFTFSVSEEAPVVADAQKKATDKMNAAIDYLKKAGIDAKDIKTTNYSIYPRYDYLAPATYSGVYYPGGKQVLAAYVVSQDVEVKVRKTADAGTLLSGIGSLGVTNVSGLNFSVDKYDDVLKEARAKAIADARANAEKLASDLGVHLVRIMDYSDQSNGYPSPIYYARDTAMAMGGNAVKSVAPEVPTGENKIISNVTITYEIR